MDNSDLVKGIHGKGDKELVLLIAKMIPEDVQPAWLIRSIISMSATYDHIVDNDSYTIEEVHNMVGDMLYYFPTNPFFVRHQQVLRVLLLNSIHAWKFAESCPDYRIKVADCISEIGCACLLLTGGLTRLNTEGNKWRQACYNLLKQSDKR